MSKDVPQKAHLFFPKKNKIEQMDEIGLQRDLQKPEKCTKCRCYHNPSLKITTLCFEIDLKFGRILIPRVYTQNLERKKQKHPTSKLAKIQNGSPA